MNEQKRNCMNTGMALFFAALDDDFAEKLQSIGGNEKSFNPGGDMMSMRESIRRESQAK